MKLNSKFYEIFPKIPIIGMLHMAGSDPVKRALEELVIFEEEGVDAAILENYHGTKLDIDKTLKQLSSQRTKVILGINILPNEFEESYNFIDRYPSLKFIQLDFVAGVYKPNISLDSVRYSKIKKEHSNIVVLGGVWPKYYSPLDDSNLEADIMEGMQMAEAIVVTGEGTGQETPQSKIKYFRRVLRNHPLIVGAGLTPENAYEQLMKADGAIVGGYLKLNNHTENKVDRNRVRKLMAIVNQVRKRKLR